MAAVENVLKIKYTEQNVKQEKENKPAVETEENIFELSGKQTSPIISENKIGKNIIFTGDATTEQVGEKNIFAGAFNEKQMPGNNFLSLPKYLDSKFDEKEKNFPKTSDIQMTDNELDDINGYYYGNLTEKLSNNNIQKQNLGFGFPSFGDIISEIADAIDGDSKDGKIGDTKQNQTGDCWLLSGINALNATASGRAMIKNALEYNEEQKCTIVHLEGYGDVRVDDDAVKKTKASSEYSSGDDDMIIFELAVEKVLNDIANGDAMFDPDSNLYFESAEDIKKDIEEHNQTLWDGQPNSLIYLLTGKVGEYTCNKEEMKQKLQEYDENLNKDIAMTASVGKDKSVKDINGKTIKLTGPHAYSVKEVKDGVVTFINPWDSGKELKMDIDSFTDAFGDISTVDLSKNNPKQDLISRSWRYDEDGNKLFQFYGDDNSRKEVDQNGTVRYREKNSDIPSGRVSLKVRYDENGNTIWSETDLYDKNGNILSSDNTECDGKGNKKITQTYFDKNGNVERSECFEYNADNQCTGETIFDKNGEIKQKTVYVYDKNGNKTGAKIYDKNGKLIETKRYDPKTGKEI